MNLEIIVTNHIRQNTGRKDKTRQDKNTKYKA